jgi:hypothetical protein
MWLLTVRVLSAPNTHNSIVVDRMAYFERPIWDYSPAAVNDNDDAARKSLVTISSARPIQGGADTSVGIGFGIRISRMSTEIRDSSPVSTQETERLRPYASPGYISIHICRHFVATCLISSEKIG